MPRRAAASRARAARLRRSRAGRPPARPRRCRSRVRVSYGTHSVKAPARPLRVLHVIPSTGIGGAERVLATILAGLDSEHFDSWVAADGDGDMLDEYRRHASGVS